MFSNITVLFYAAHSSEWCILPCVVFIRRTSLIMSERNHSVAETDVSKEREIEYHDHVPFRPRDSWHPANRRGESNSESTTCFVNVFSHSQTTRYRQVDDTLAESTTTAGKSRSSIGTALMIQGIRKSSKLLALIGVR